MNFLKYLPNNMLTAEQQNYKKQALEKDKIKYEKKQAESERKRAGIEKRKAEKQKLINDKTSVPQILNTNSNNSLNVDNSVSNQITESAIIPP